MFSQASLADHGHNHDNDVDMAANVAGEHEGEVSFCRIILLLHCFLCSALQISLENEENEVVATGSVEKKEKVNFCLLMLMKKRVGFSHLLVFRALLKVFLLRSPSPRLWWWRRWRRWWISVLS